METGRSDDDGGGGDPPREEEGSAGPADAEDRADDGGGAARAGGGGADAAIFPQQLMELLEAEANRQPPTLDGGGRLVIEWLEDGKAFVIRDKARLEKEVLPRYFNARCKFMSFLRKLYRWGFRQMEKKTDPEHYTFMHANFVRGERERCLTMRSVAKRHGPTVPSSAVAAMARQQRENEATALRQMMMSAAARGLFPGANALNNAFGGMAPWMMGGANMMNMSNPMMAARLQLQQQCLQQMMRGQGGAANAIDMGMTAGGMNALASGVLGGAMSGGGKPASGSETGGGGGGPSSAIGPGQQQFLARMMLLQRQQMQNQQMQQQFQQYLSQQRQQQDAQQRQPPQQESSRRTKEKLPQEQKQPQQQQEKQERTYQL